MTWDETWDSYIDVEKQQFMQWYHSSSLKPEKLKQPLSSRNYGYENSWNKKNIVYKIEHEIS